MERWHLSYAPLASRCEPLLSDQCLAEAISSCGLVLADPVLAALPELFRRFVLAVSSPPAARL